MTPFELLITIDKYLVKNDLAATRFSKFVMGDGAFLYRLRKSTSIRQSTVDRCLNFMLANPNAEAIEPPPRKEKQPKILKRQLPKKERVEKHHDQFKSLNKHFQRSKRNPDDSHLVIIDRTPCFNCGVRADVGCHHQPKSAPERLR